MTIFETMMEVENQKNQLDLARAVLSEVKGKFEEKITPGSTEAYCFIMQLGHILLLLQAADEFLWKMGPELAKVVDELHEEHKRQKEEQSLKEG